MSSKATRLFRLYEPEFPEWLNEYINTAELQTQKNVHTACGITETKLFNNAARYSSLEHSIGVALIIWHFTHDKKQTLAGLFHDIATPAFKHCVDFLHNDYMKQETTESRTSEFINKPDVVKLLKRDNIKLSEIDNYHLYPIADNDTPQLSAGRLEYTLSNIYAVFQIGNLSKVRRFYNDIEVGKNEKGEPELTFKTLEIARDFVKITSELSVCYRGYKDCYSMQFIADILGHLIEDGAFSENDLYNLSEDSVIKIINHSKYRGIFNIWRQSTEIKTSKTCPKDVYSVHHPSKTRYIDPLVKGKRISKIDAESQKMIQKNLNTKFEDYAYIPEIHEF